MMCTEINENVEKRSHNIQVRRKSWIHCFSQIHTNSLWDLFWETHPPSKMYVSYINVTYMIIILELV